MKRATFMDWLMKTVTGLARTRLCDRAHVVCAGRVVPMEGAKGGEGRV